MNELQIISLENTDISTWDFSAIKAELERHLSDYAGIVYTDDTIKDAKKDRTKLNKAKKAVEGARKAYRDKCLEPYEALVPQIRELTDLIEKCWKPINDTVKDYESRQKEIKEKEVRGYYDRISGSFGENADRIWQKIFDPKWTNVTTAVAKYKEGIQIAVDSVTRDLESIKGLGSPFRDTLTELYLETMSMDTVLQKNEELKEAADKAGLTTAEFPAAVPAAEEKPVEIPKANEAEGTLLKVYASQPSLNQICDFMKAIGVTYEIL